MHGTVGVYEQKLCDAAQGDRQAFSDIYDAFVGKMYAYAMFRLKHRDMAEDVVSDTFLKALEHVTSFDPARGSASSWLYRIARNTLIDYIRKNKKTITLSSDFDIVDTFELKKDIENKHTLVQVEQALKKLSEKEREIIMLRVWDELSYKEIAEIVGKSEASLKMASSRALHSLRKHLPLGVYLAFVIHFFGITWK